VEIRANGKNLERLRKQKTTLTDVTFTQDENVELPIIMILSDGKLSEYMRGTKNVLNFLKYGYNRITRKCPCRHRKCIGEKCSWYYIQNGTGDCVHVWNIELMWNQRPRK